MTDTFYVINRDLFAPNPKLTKEMERQLHRKAPKQIQPNKKHDLVMTAQP